MFKTLFSSQKKKENDHPVPFGKMKDEAFYFHDIRKYFDKREGKQAFHTITEHTANDIDFEELFMFLDRTNSKIGQQYLYDKLRNIGNDAGKLAENEQLISEITRDAALRHRLQHALLKLIKREAYFICNLFQDEHLKPPRWFIAIKILSIAAVVSLVAAFFYPLALLVSLGVFVSNMVVHYWNKRNLMQYSNAIGQLTSMQSAATILAKESHLKEIAFQLEPSMKVLGQVKQSMSYFQIDTRLENDISMIFYSAMELIKIYFLLEPILLFNALSKLDSRRLEIENVFQFIGRIDGLYSIASLRAGAVFCLPQFTEKPEFEANNIYHPLLENPVANNIKLNNKSVLLTGSNMSGKTSFIRTIAINALTAQALNTCFADELVLQRMKIYTAIRISDDLLNNKSYYFEEVIRIREMIGVSEEKTPCLFLLDELYKGTNTLERIAAAEAVLHYLAHHNNLIFVATHDIELGDMLETQYDRYHFSESIKNKNVDFDYKLKTGLIKDTNAIKILAINNYPKEIIARATANLKR